MKKYKYIKFFPKPFLDDLVDNRVFPIVGAGFSKNANIPRGKKMPDWNELGKGIAEEIPDYKFTNPIDAISAYSHEYSRTSLIEKITKLLHVDCIEPGNAHVAFCNLQFDIVCTTNFEFLLEKGYQFVPRYCIPIVEEEQLAISNIKDGVTLIKLHGDLHHPNKLVITEEDYDKFLHKNPMLATHVANLLISRTALFIGYSLDDSDFRQVWQVIKERLGNLKRHAYVLKVNCSSPEKARYERRGVKVIDIKDDVLSYGDILTEVFNELKEYWTENILTKTIVSEDEGLAEILLPSNINNRLCFFSIPIKLLPFYKRHIFPIVYKYGLVPISADDVILPGDNWVAKVTALISKAEFAVFDVSSNNTVFELGTVLGKDTNKKIMVIAEKHHNLLIHNINDIWVHLRENDPYEDIEEIQSFFDKWLDNILDEPLKKQLNDEARRLLEKKEYKYAVVAAFSLLEAFLRERLENNNERNRIRHIIGLFESAVHQQIITNEEYNQLKNWFAIRNKVIHSEGTVTAHEAKEIVEGIYNILKR